MSKILVAVDGSDAAIHAARKALELSADVTLATVVTPLFVPVEVAFDASAFQEEALKAAELLLANAAKELGKPALSRVCLQGSVAECIADYADAHHFDLIAVGSKGRGAVSRVLLGSNTDRLVHIAKKPVLVVR
ncbi:MAG: universal stress protein [Archangium sp.]|nr:universal stress protein [Archangium sp.]